MTGIDLALIAAYFALVIGLGFWYQRRASQNLDSYFLGGKGLHWLLLSMSGAVSNFDITGTMWIVSILVLLGMRSMWHHWMWGVFMGAFFLSYMGKWVRRSGTMTAAEWMKTRFGDDAAGRFSRTVYAIMAVIFIACFIGYAYQGIGKFASVYIPLEKLAGWTSAGWLQSLATEYEAHVLAVLIMGATALYVILGGLYSVVITEVIQTVILTVAAIFIAFLAWSQLSRDPSLLEKVPEGWTSLSVPWTLEDVPPEFHFFGALVIVWIVKGFLLNAGGPGQMYDFQRFLAARDARDAAKVGATWSLFLIVRWGMCAGIALLALTGAIGIDDSEKAMPIILQHHLPSGIRGIVVAGLLAAFMSTYSATVNSGASFLVRDLWQPFWRPQASNQEAVRASYWATGILVLTGIVIGMNASSIAQIWNWIMMALGACVIIPNVLRWYWWRLNGWGYAAGTLGGIVMSAVTLFFPKEPVYLTFPLICAGSLVLSVGVSLATSPVSESILTEFFRSVRPFGFWRPVRIAANLSAEALQDRRESLFLAGMNVILGMAAISGGYLFPMYLVGHWYGWAGFWLGILLAAVVALYFTWYRNLPPAEHRGE